MIEISKLTEADIGRRVVFTYHHGESETGSLTGWSPRVIFVRFNLHPQGCQPEMCGWEMP